MFSKSMLVSHIRRNINRVPWPFLGKSLIVLDCIVMLTKVRHYFPYAAMFFFFLIVYEYLHLQALITQNLKNLKNKLLSEHSLAWLVRVHFVLIV